MVAFNFIELSKIGLFVDWAVERIRKREQKKLLTYSAMVKSNKRVLMKHPNRLTAQELIKLEEILRVSDDLRNAYRLNLAFRKAFRVWGKERVLACIDRRPVLVKEADLPEFKNFFVSFASYFALNEKNKLGLFGSLVPTKLNVTDDDLSNENISVINSIQFFL